MFKQIVLLFAAVAYVAAAPKPQVLLSSSVLDNEGAKQLGLQFANGWTDGPNNGIGPAQVLVSSSSLAQPIQLVRSGGLIQASPLLSGVPLLSSSSLGEVQVVRSSLSGVPTLLSSSSSLGQLSLSNGNILLI